MKDMNRNPNKATMSDEAVTNIHKPAKQDTGGLRADRIEHFMELTYRSGLAFTRKEAEVLADVMDYDVVMIGKKDNKVEKRYERPLHVSKVRKMLDAGCHPKMVLRILGD